MGSVKLRASEPDVYRLFRRLRPKDRRTVAVRILRDEQVLADLYDHFLIHEAMEQTGRSIPWTSFRSRKSSARR